MLRFVGNRSLGLLCGRNVELWKGMERSIHSSPVVGKDLISGALDEVLAEEEEGDEKIEQVFEESKPVQDFSTAKRKNAKGSLWRYDCLIKLIRGKPLNESFDILKQAHKHRKAQVLHKLLWAARSAAEHNYSLDPDKLYIHSIRGSKGVHLTGRVIMHGRGRAGRKTRPRTHLYVTLKEMPDSMINRIQQWEEREVLWKEHMLSKVDDFANRFPEIQFILPVTRSDQIKQNTKRALNTHEPLPQHSSSELQN